MMMKYLLSKDEIQELESVMDCNGYEIVCSMSEFIDMLNENYYLFSKEDTIDNILELYGADELPHNWLDMDEVLNDAEDYAMLGDDRYLNVYRFVEDEDKLIDGNYIKIGE